MIKIFAKRDLQSMFNGKKLYHGFPRPLHGKHDTARSWMQRGKSQDTKEFTVENKFKAYIIDDVATRGMSSKIPQVVLYLEDDDVYIRMDFRLDGLIDILLNHSVTKGAVNVDVGIRFSGTNYYIEELSKIPEISSPVDKSNIKKKAKLKPVVGEYYTGMHYGIKYSSQYLGLFTASKGTITESYGDISDKKYHVFATYLYPQTVIDCYRSVPVNINKSNSGVDYTNQLKIVTDRGTLGQYGLGDNDQIVINMTNKTFSFS